MKLLALDGSASLCAACVFDADDGRELGRAVLDLGKGHAEQLMGVIADALRESSTAYADLGMVAASTGPGSFTGVRVTVSVARGLALALKIPARGVSTLEAIAARARETFGPRAVLSALGAGDGAVHLALFGETGEEIEAPRATTIADAVSLARQHRPVLAGTAAPSIADGCRGLGLDMASPDATADIAVYARLSLRQGRAADRPRPLYLRAPDAKPQAGFTVARR